MIKIVKKYLAYRDIMRLGSPTGYLLLFFPCVFGLAFAIKSFGDLLYVPIFFVGSILMRSAGCVINDLFDQEFDAKVERTRSRPLVTGAISRKEAITLVFLLLSVSFLILLTLSKLAIIISIISLLFVVAYPLMKRITFWPQIFLGITFNIGVLVGYTTLANSLSYTIVLVYLACILWTTGYDTIYAFMDLKDDQLIGVKSSALFLYEKNYKIYLFLFYFLFNIMMYFAAISSGGYSNILMITTISVVSILLWQIITLEITSQHNCLVRFKSNIYVGFIWSIGLIIHFGMGV